MIAIGWGRKRKHIRPFSYRAEVLQNRGPRKAKWTAAPGDNPQSGSAAKTIDVLEVRTRFVSVADALYPIAALESEALAVKPDSDAGKRKDIDDVARAPVLLQIT